MLAADQLCDSSNSATHNSIAALKLSTGANAAGTTVPTNRLGYCVALGRCGAKRGEARRFERLRAVGPSSKKATLPTAAHCTAGAV
jgi:hypothetical protein